jgi:uncharacterized protein RhaS with RHS repeats
MYDGATGRWLVPDPAAQFANPYLAMGNNPLMGVDPDGRIVFGLIRGLLNSIFSGGLEFWNAGKRDYVGKAWRKSDPFLRGTAGNNAGRIWGGLFQGNFGQIVSRFTWELPQTIAGFTLSHGLNILGNVKNVGYFDGATVVDAKNVPFTIAVTLGSYINGEDIASNPYETNASGFANERSSLFMHEYGHYLQSQKSGPLYLPKYGVSSAGKQGWTEGEANNRANIYFSERHNVQHYWADFDSHEIINTKWWEYLFLVSPATIISYSLLNLNNPI